jgi:hypothetical protein
MKKNTKKIKKIIKHKFNSNMSLEDNMINKGLSQYSTNEIIEFINQLGLDNYSKKIEQLQIDGYDLSIINDNLINSLEILNPHDLNKLKKNIHLKLIQQLQIGFSYLGHIYPLQLDYIPDLTIDNISKNLSIAFNIKEPFLLSTMDNQMLSPQIKFIDLFLIEPDRYKILKIFNPKEISSQIINKNNQQKTYSNFDIRKSSPIITKNIDLNKKEIENIAYKVHMNENRPHSITKDQMNLYKPELNENIESTSQIKSNNYSTDYGLYKNFKPTNNILTQNNQIDNKINISNPNNISSQINQYQQKTKSSDILGDLNNNLKLMKDNILNNNILQDNNQITNISPQKKNYTVLNTYNQNNKENLQNPTLESLVQESPDPRLYQDKIQMIENMNLNKKKPNYNYNVNSGKTNNNITEPSVAQQADIILKKYQSEQRVFRPNSNIQTETNLSFDNKKFQKYNQNPLEEINDKYKNIGINRINKDELNNINNFPITNQNKVALSLRGTNENYDIERKPIQMTQKIESYKYMNIEKGE